MSKNKIFAVSFLALACLFFFGHYLFLEINCSWTYFRTSSWLNILFFAIDAIMYLILLTCNIRNDDFAYTGIALFVSMKAFEYIKTFFYNQMGFLNSLSSGSIWNWLLSSLYMSFLAGEAGVGIALYVFVVRYQRGSPNFTLVRVFGIIFAALLALTAITYSLIFFQGVAFSWDLLLSYIALPAAEACVGVGIVFTLERLRRC